MKKGLISFLVVAILSVVMVSGAYAWNAHTVISTASRVGNSALSSDVPDSWGESHFGASYLASKVQYWTNSAKGRAWYDPYKLLYSGYALHYMQDAGQPWHAAGVGGSLHIEYEGYIAALYTTYMAWVTSGSYSAVYISSGTDAYNKCIGLQNIVRPYYSYLDTRAEWMPNASYTKDALWYVGSYGKGLDSYIWR